jgi:hypothetical protein
MHTEKSSCCRFPSCAVLCLAVLVSGPDALSRAAGSEAAEAPLITATLDQREELALTVYSQGFGLVSDRRRVDLPGGSFRLRWDGVPEQLDPASVFLAPVGGKEGLTILEQFYDDDLVSPARLLELYVGREITLVQEDRDLREKRTPARLLSTSGPTVEVDGTVVVGHPGRIELPELPPGLLLRPSLGWLAAGKTSGRMLLEARYLTGGLTWTAGYRLDLNQEETAAELSGLVSVENRSGTDYPDVSLRLVAGDVNRQAPGGQNSGRNKMMRAPAAEMDMAAGSAADFGEEALSGYYLYTLGRSAAVLDNRTTRLSLVEAAGVPVERQLILRGNPMHPGSSYGEVQREPVAVVLRVKNSEKDGLGRPLPAGVWQVFKEDSSGAQLFLGESRFGHSARGTEVVIGVGNSFDVTAERVQTDYRELSNVRWDVETAYRITLRNGGSRDVEVLVREPVQGQWELRGASQDHTRVDASTLGFTVAVAAGSSAVLEYRVAIDW